MKAIEKIYFDLDGVLADFNKGLIDICKITPVDQSISTEDDDNATFEAIRKANHFYRNLELIPGSKNLFDKLFNLYGEKCEILTGVPNPKRNIPEATEDKIEWVREKISDKVVIHTVRRAEKKDYCKGAGYVLIDDYQKNIDEWTAAGGTGILFQNADQAMEDIDKLIDNAAEEDDEMEEKREIRTIKPMSSIDFGDILDKWNDSFNREISNWTEQWKLLSHPIMPGKDTTQVALIFGQEIEVNESDCRCIYKYRILLYDITVEPVLVNSSEFQFKDWRVHAAWFNDGRLYAAMRDGDKFDVITICGDGNEKVVSVGKYATRICSTSKGDIVVGYDCCIDDPENREPLYLYRRKNGNKTLTLDEAVTCEAVCVDSHDNIWAYVKPYNYVCHMEGDDMEHFQICMTGFNGMGVSDDGKTMLTSMNYAYFGTRLYMHKRSEDDIFCDSTEVVLDIGEDDNNKTLVSAAFAGNKAVVRKEKHLYMININELSWDKQEQESQKNAESEE